jgi:hypothetical protein
MSFSSWLRNWKASLERRAALDQTMRRRSSGRRFVSRPRLEALEDRVLLSPYIVTTTADSGAGSLRDAITQVNADTSHALYASPSNPNVDEIDFNITAASDTGGGFNATTGVATIQPQSALPTITNAVIINGYSQSGATPNTQAVGDNAVLKIELRGSSSIANGLELSGSSSNGSSIEGLSMNSFGSSGAANMILLDASNDDTIQGNFIGLDASGESSPASGPNFIPYPTNGRQGNGIRLQDAQNDLIGTNGDGANDPAERNVISNCPVGVSFDSSSKNAVAGNFIGTDASGTKEIGNWDGIGFGNGNSSNRIGTNGTDADAAGEGNLISGNEVGITFGSGALGIPAETGGTVEGNMIGPDVNGKTLKGASGNLSWQGNLLAGIGLLESDSGIQIGGSNPVQANIIAYNQGPGVSLVTFRNETATHITIQGNSIHDNLGPGIDEGGTYSTSTGLTLGPDNASSLLIADGTGTGPNDLQHYPPLTFAQAGSSTTTISGSLSTNNAGPYMLDFYDNGSSPDPSGYGQGKSYLGSAIITNTGSFSVILPVATAAGDYLTATATDAAGDTSIFSNDIQATAAAGGYAVLYEGTGGHNLSITNVTVNGNIGVGGTGVVQFSGPGTIAGNLDFSAVNSGQFHNTNGSNVGPTSTNYNVASVTNTLNTVNSLNNSLAGLGNSLAISGNQTINESAGQLETINGVTYRAFQVTSYSEGNGNLLTIQGDGSGNPVVLNFGYNSNVNLGGDVSLTGGLTDDQVLWNFTTSGKNISLNNNASSYPLPAAFHGIILAPRDAISLSNANLDGRVFGGDSSDMQVVSGDTINAPATAPPYLFFAGNLEAALLQIQSSPTANSMTIRASASVTPATVIQAVNGLTNVTQPVTIILDLGGGTYSTGGVTANPPHNVTFVIQNGTLDPAYPALTVAGGQVSVVNCTLTTSGDAPTLLVTGGNVTLNDDAISQTSTSSTQPAIAVTGGIVNLGTATAPGNTLSVSNYGNLVSNTSGNAISAVGDTFVVGGTVESAPNLSFTTLTSSAATSILNQAVTLTATVQANDASDTPSGSVDFFDTTTNTDLGSVTLSGGVAKLTTSALTLGNQVIVAKYSGDANFLPSANPFTENVNYNFGGFQPPLSNGLTFAVNRTIPIKFQLSDYDGNAITDLSTVTSLQIQALDANGNPVGAPFASVSTNSQGLQNSGGQYLFNWQTKGLSAGSYGIVLTLADGTTQTKTIQLTAGGKSAGLVTDGSSGTATAGALLGGEADLYVDNSNGELTSDELARIQDAVTSIDATIAPYGVVINEVSDPTQANVTLNMNTTSSLGGAAQGVLGCTTDADQVTMIQGWDWYAGSDLTQVSAGQYDFETAVMHELGHVLGLGHSSNSTSVMYASLATGTPNRVLTTADLNVADDDSGPCALHAASTAAAIGTSNSPSITTSSSTSISGSGSANRSSPMSAADQLFANYTLVLNEMRNGNQPSLSSVAALWQSIDALVLQRLDALLSMEAGAMGMTKDALMHDLFLANLFTPSDR